MHEPQLLPAFTVAAGNPTDPVLSPKASSIMARHLCAIADIEFLHRTAGTPRENGPTTWSMRTSAGICLTPIDGDGVSLVHDGTQKTLATMRLS